MVKDIAWETMEEAEVLDGQLHQEHIPFKVWLRVEIMLYLEMITERYIL